MKPIIFFLFLIHSLAASEEVHRVKTDYPQLVTFFGKQKFKVPSQTNTDLKATYTIPEAGTYVLTEDIASMAALNHVIYITTDNVTLDLAGKSITLIAGSGSPINGITIAPGISNVTIKNGIIESMNGHGILIHNNCSHITLENITLLKCVTSGITFQGTNGNIINGCSIKNCCIQECNGITTDTYGLKLLYCNAFSIQHSFFISNKTSQLAKNAYAFYTIHSKNIECDSCVIEDLTASKIASGFYLDTDSLQCSFKKCKTKSIISTSTTNTGRAYGFYQLDSFNNSFEECSSIHASSYALSAGFYTQNSSYSTFKECTSTYHIITGNANTIGGFGFLSDTGICDGTMFDHCNAFGNKGSRDVNSRGCGFSIDNSQGCTIQYCRSQANDGVSGSGIGIEIKQNAVRCAIAYNIVIANTSATLSKAYGIYDEGTVLSSTNVLYANFAFGNKDETILGTNQNYITPYSQNNVVQSVAKTNVQNINANPYQNVGVTP